MIPGQALLLWNLPPNTKITLLAERENRVYRLQTPTGEKAVLRLHRPDYRTDAELEADLQWMAYLAAHGMQVPTPIVSRQQRFHETVAGWQADCLSWLAGTALGASNQPLQLADRVGTFHRLGEIMARLHTLSDDWEIPTGFSRPHWNKQDLLGEQPLWGRFWENPYLSATQRKLLLAARHKANTFLTTAGDTLDYGLIHADLVRENVLLHEGEIQLLDFDDSGFGYRLFEVATALLKNRSEPDYTELEQALLAGYQQLRPLAVEALPLFLLLRALTYVGWIVPRMNEPGSARRCERFITTALTLSEDYLNA